MSKDAKTLLDTLFKARVDLTAIGQVLNTIPECEAIAPSQAAVASAKRSAPEAWNIKPHYFDEAGSETEYNSPSELVKHLGFQMSGIQCDSEGNKCRVMNAVDILRVHGYTVSGDGEPKKASQGGTKLTVYHPLAPQLKKEGD
jgi:hypothetical protein